MGGAPGGFAPHVAGVNPGGPHVAVNHGEMRGRGFRGRGGFWGGYGGLYAYDPCYGYGYGYPYGGYGYDACYGGDYDYGY
jgi:hypothetical protein